MFPSRGLLGGLNSGVTLESRWQDERGATLSDAPLGEGWWIASDGRWYPPDLHPDVTATKVSRRPEPPGPGWWMAADGNWYPPELHPEFGSAIPRLARAQYRPVPATGHDGLRETARPETSTRTTPEPDPTSAEVKGGATESPAPAPAMTGTAPLGAEPAGAATSPSQDIDARPRHRIHGPIAGESRFDDFEPLEERESVGAAKGAGATRTYDAPRIPKLESSDFFGRKPPVLRHRVTIPAVLAILLVLAAAAAAAYYLVVIR